jgi:hypothetical protein
VNIMDGVRKGTAKPKSHADWVSSLRGQSTSRVLIKNNKARSQAFLDRIVPSP